MNRKHLKLGDPVRVLPNSEYRRAGEIGTVAAYHGVLDDWIFVRFGRNKRPELIERECLEPATDYHDDDPDPYRSPTRPEHDLDTVGRALKPRS